MKIFIAVHHFLPYHIGGAELRVYDMALWLIDQGHEVHVISIKDIKTKSQKGLLWEEDIYHGIRVHRLSLDLHGHPDKFRLMYENPVLEECLRDFLLNEKPDVFHLVSGYLLGAGAIRAVKSLEIPLVITLTDFWFICPRINLLKPDGVVADDNEFNPGVCAFCNLQEKRRYSIGQKIAPGLNEKFWKKIVEYPLGHRLILEDAEKKYSRRYAVLMSELKRADSLICPSTFVREKFVERGVPEDLLIFNPHGLVKSQKQEFKNENLQANGTFSFGFLGQIKYHKGVHLLIEAFEQLSNDKKVQLVIHGKMGDDPEYSEMIRRMAQRNPAVHLTGEYNPSQVGKLLSEIDVLVIPSVWNEIGPLVLYEAFQSNVPVIASDLPNMSYEVQHEENGLLFTPGSVSDLAEKMKTVIQDSRFLEKMREGIKPVRTLDEEMYGIIEVYKKVTAL